jgi:hypothetical protein
MQFRLAHGNTSKHRVMMKRVYSCFVIYVSKY